MLEVGKSWNVQFLSLFFKFTFAHKMYSSKTQEKENTQLYTLENSLKAIPRKILKDTDDLFPASLM
jgi:hypothetical protein